ncbi:chemotaxis protein CheW [Phototrophicus methaneseepsis]|uniref:Chemotaxis protein CheW n=1 Tax=Phototrophicus methaneseepsis TaxID=2710758 RepID=A0A7S8ECW9_9CHLR|nr:chemotaxis protein CheW [Phototrophicus methaneseepsis]QPC84667.1 chemotaxis protein CheW [Phototrophicus methaneseepsis]
MTTSMATEKTTDIALLTFMLAGRRYAMCVTDVVEVSAIVALNEAPGAQAGLLGIANRHGTPLPVYDLRLLMQMGARQVSVDSLFIVCKAYQAHVGLIVDEIQQVIYVPRHAISSVAGAAPAFEEVASYENALIQLIAPGPLLAPLMSSTQERQPPPSEDGRAGVSV